MRPHEGAMAAAGRQARSRPLDDYTSALWACWSCRPLLSSYTGALIRVRRSSDSTEQDIGQSGGALDTAALTAFVGAGTGKIVRFYDQSGNGRDGLSIAYGADIVIAGALQTMAGIACAVYPSAASNAGFYVAQKPSAISVFVSVETTDNKCVTASDGPNSAAYLGCWQQSHPSPTGSSSGTPAAYADGVFYAPRSALYPPVATGSPVIVTCTGANLSGWATQVRVLGYSFTYDYTGKCIDQVIYSSAALADRASIESALGADL